MAVLAASLLLGLVALVSFHLVPRNLRPTGLQYTLLVASVILLFTLAFYLLRYFIRLLSERKAGILGSRFKFKLVVTFIALCRPSCSPSTILRVEASTGRSDPTSSASSSARTGCPAVLRGREADWRASGKSPRTSPPRAPEPAEPGGGGGAARTGGETQLSGARVPTPAAGGDRRASSGGQDRVSSASPHDPQASTRPHDGAVGWAFERGSTARSVLAGKAVPGPGRAETR
jgi:hypothetical protein